LGKITPKRCVRAEPSGTTIALLIDGENFFNDQGSGFIFGQG